MKKWLLSFAVALVLYLGAWEAMFLWPPLRSMEAHVIAFEKAEGWDRKYVVFSDTPVIDNHIAIYGPGIVRFDWAHGYGNMGMHGMRGWFVWTPFKIFTISVRETWIS